MHYHGSRLFGDCLFLHEIDLVILVLVYGLFEMSKIDLSREFKGLYKAKQVPELIDVPVGKFLAIEGKGDPNGGVSAGDDGAIWSRLHAEVSIQGSRYGFQGDGS